jgi:hypothetical protein
MRWAAGLVLLVGCGGVVQPAEDRRPRLDNGWGLGRTKDALRSCVQGKHSWEACRCTVALLEQQFRDYQLFAELDEAYRQWVIDCAFTKCNKLK